MKAQISLDFILALVVAFIAIGAIVAISNETRALQAHSSVRQQLGSIGTNLAAVITASAALDDVDNTSASIEIPKLLVLGEKTLQECKIVVSGSNLDLSYELVDVETGTAETIAVLVPFVDPSPDKTIPHMVLTPALTESDPGKCGKTLTIIKS